MKFSAYTLLLLCLLSTFCQAQSDEQKAQSAYLNAEDSFNQRDYLGAVKGLYKAKEYLGSTNPKIQYLLVKSLYSGTCYSRAKTELSEYLRLVQGSEDDEGPKYAEMLRLVDRIDAAVERKETEDRQKKERQEIDLQEEQRRTQVAQQAVQQENRRQEASRQESQRMENENNKRRSVIGFWESPNSISDDYPKKVQIIQKYGFIEIKMTGYDEFTSYEGNYVNTGFKIDYSITGRNCPSNNLSFCNSLTGLMNVGYFFPKGGTGYVTRKSIECKIGLNCIDNQLLGVFEIS